MSENIFNGQTSEPSPSSGALTGYNVVIQILGEDIAKAERITIDVDNNIRQQYVVGNRTALIIETGVSITGSIRMLYVNTGLLRLVLGNAPENIPPYGTDITKTTVLGWMGTDIATPSFASPDDYYRLPAMTISATFIAESQQGRRTHSIDILGAKFSRFSMGIDANDIVLQDVTFFAERIKPVLS